MLGGQMSSESSCTRSSDVGIAVGGLILVEGIIATVAAIIVTVTCWLVAILYRNKIPTESDVVSNFLMLQVDTFHCTPQAEEVKQA